MTGRRAAPSSGRATVGAVPVSAPGLPAGSAYTVPEGQFGRIVSQPLTRRVQGYVYSGCTDSPSKETFMSDTYTSQSYGNLEWVQGVIRLCNSTTYPIPFCIGDGVHE